MNRSPLHLKLTVEADFHLEPGRVAIRLYTQEEGPDGYRQFLSLAGVHNHLAALRRPEGQRFYSWDERDAAFLRFLGQEVLPGLEASQLRASHFFLSRDRFLSWRQEFSNVPGRFVNRDGQAPLPSPGQSVPVGQRFVLSEKGAPPGQFRIEAFILFPGGGSAAVHELLRGTETEPGGGDELSRRELFHADLPVPWPRLAKYFSRPVSTIRKTRAPELLPALLCNRLDLLEGPAVVRQRTSEVVSAELHFSCQDHRFLIQCRLGGRALPLNGAMARLVSRLHVNSAGKLVLVEGASAPSLVEIRKALMEFAKSPLAKAGLDGISLPETAQAAEFLACAWRGIPDGVPKTASEQLRGLCPPDGVHGAGIQPGVTAEERGGFVLLQLNWGKEGCVFNADALDRCLAEKHSVLQDGQGRWLAIDPAAARTARERLLESGVLQDGNGEALLPRFEARRVMRRLRADFPLLLLPADGAGDFASRLLSEPVPELPPLSKEACERLRPYQRKGVEFLADRALCGVGSLLADDMGLGKTLQALAMLESFRAVSKAEGKDFRALVVCPGSVVGVWLEQARAFFPNLPMTAVAGNAEHRRKLLESHAGEAVFVTHYGLLRTDVALLSALQFDFLIADEAQALKNPDAMATLAIKRLEARHRIALTGTPLENRLLDVWSIMDFLNPGYLGERGDFLAESPGAGMARLASRLAPVMLRRTKEEVAEELPPRTVAVVPVELEEMQRALYDEQVVEARAAIHFAGPVEILAALTRLRQICCDPELLGMNTVDCCSAKRSLLLEQAGELLKGGHSVLVFSQFASMLKILARELRKLGLPYESITGETPLAERPAIVRRFQEAESPSILLLSLKAAGTGLTLTRADYVFLYDPWWNPAAEKQALDRTHRIGQARPVFAYRLVARGTIEERVLELLAAKQELFEAVVENASGQGISGRLAREDLARLLE
ncbi:MAG: DEAD/DEAH box helicase [Victivallales bacterium]|nr:DEAD/DEAH box helicase [Victivallales bacterium]